MILNWLVNNKEKWKKKIGIVTADKLRTRHQNKAALKSVAIKLLNRPNPQRPTEKLNKLQVAFKTFLGLEYKINKEHITLLEKITMPEPAK